MAVMPLHLTTLSSMFSVINYYLWIITIKSRLKLKNSTTAAAAFSVIILKLKIMIPFPSASLPECAKRLLIGG